MLRMVGSTFLKDEIEELHRGADSEQRKPSLA
jgi:hypothetical protein